MQMSKEEFVKTVQKCAKREREQKEMQEKEHDRRLEFELRDYIITTSRKNKWGRNYRKSRSRKWISGD